MDKHKRIVWIINETKMYKMYVLFFFVNFFDIKLSFLLFEYITIVTAAARLDP